ncbi:MULTISPECIES: cadmium resistance transporter [unclassified Synechococcus]|uniref:cadmium resistance transporter n=1 Tax=unclassified Synechococcus TaxID=2626047 RepID=UPI000674D9E2|nr:MULTISPECIES: cadmium resistance transporter [unclassified Synechococcus]
MGLAGLILISLLGYLGGLVLPPSAIGLLGLIPLAVGGWKLWRSEAEEALSKELEKLQDRPPAKTGLLFLPSPALLSMLLTFANGGDNISLYVPLFAGSTPLQLALFSIIFFLMKGLWFAMAQRLTVQPEVAKILAEQGERWVPWILMRLGVWILFKNETWRWLLGIP